MNKQVKGALFKEYIQMIKKNKQIDWSKHLTPSDMETIEHGIITAVEWYPYEVFQRMGEAVFQEIAGGKTDVARAWGRKTMENLAGLYKSNLVENGEPFQTLKKFSIINKHFFDFQGFEVFVVDDNKVDIKIDTAFGDRGVLGYSYQMLGSFERLIEMSGVKDVKAGFIKKTWDRDPNTVISIRWLDTES